MSLQRTSNPTPNPRYFKVYGEGVGEKARQLILKTEPILDSGFLLDKRNILGWSFFSDFLKRCGAESAIVAGDFRKARRLILRGKFSESEKKVIEEICRDFVQSPVLVIRSSAEGDSRGTGVYSSFFRKNNPRLVERSVKGVLASHFTESAMLFRRDAKLADGIGVMIDPMVCERFVDEGQEFFAPRISGFGRTYSPFYEGKLLGVVHGLAASFVKDPLMGRIITDRDVRFVLNRTPWRNNDPNEVDFDDVYTVGSKGTPESSQSPLVFSGGKVQKVSSDELGFVRATPNEFFRKMDVLVEKCGGIRQYFEYALKGEMKPEIHITQISDIPPKKLDDLGPEKGRLVLKADSVSGSACFDSEWLVIMNRHEGWEENLGEINRKYKGYVLLASNDSVLSVRSTNPMFRGKTVFKSVKYADISNMAMLGFEGEFGISQFAAHFGGCLEATNKVVACFNSIPLERLTVGREPVERKYSYRVYNVPLSVRASEDEQIAEIRLRD